MTSDTDQDSDRAAHRAAIERIIAHYPNISEDELHTVIQYFRHDASAYDRAMIASNDEIHDRYRQLSADQSLDRLSRVEIVAVVLIGSLLVLGILFFTLGGWEL